MKSISTKFLFEEVNPATLGLLRILFGIFILKDFISFYYYFIDLLVQSKYFATYDGFHWVRILPLPFLYVFFGVMVVACLFFILGIYYRLSAGLIFVGFTYIFLIDIGHYNNHFYLYCLMSFLFFITNANLWGSLEKQTAKTVPYWQLLVFKVQLFIVYFYGAIAKISSDWFQGYPMRYWLHLVSYKFENWFADVLKEEWFAYFISYSGFFFDLFIGFMLFSVKFQRIAIVFVFMFHLMNHFMWDIGTFPFAMFSASCIFFAPNWPQKAFDYFKSKDKYISLSFFIGLIILAVGTYSYSPKIVLVGGVFWSYFLIRELRLPFFKWILSMHSDKPDYQNINYSFKYKKLVLSFLGIWFFWQLFFPFRHWVLVGDPSWNGHGHLFAWRMMLISTTDAVKVKLVDPETKAAYQVQLEAYMNFRQFSKLGRTPKTYLHFAHFIRDEAIKGGMKNPIVKMEIWKSVNERTPRLLNDTTLNYAEVPYQSFVMGTWCNDWNPSMDPVEFREDKFIHWEKVINSSTKQGVAY